MSYIKIKSEKFNDFFAYGVAFFPLALILGSFIAEVISFLCILFFLLCLDKKNYKKYFLNNFSKFFIIFYLLVLITSLINFNNFRWFIPALFYFRVFLFALSVWFILDKSNFFESKKKNIIIITFLVLIFDSLYQTFNGENLLGYEIQREGRISSFFFNELILGGYVLRLLPILIIILLINAKDKINSIILCIFLALSLLVIILSGERISTFLGFLYLILLLVLSARIRKFLLVSLSILGILLAVISIYDIGKINFKKRLIDKTIQQISGNDLNPVLYERKGVKRELGKLFGKFYIFSYDHHAHYILASKMIIDSPMVGKGVRGFRWLCFKTDKYKNIDNSGCSTHPHHTYLQILVSTGIFGLMMFLFLFFYILKIYFKNLGQKFDQRNENLIYQNILIGIIIVNLWPLVPSGNFYNNWLSLLYFYPVGFYLYFKNKANNYEKTS